tara:strand:- start:32363 stop:32992 length:630 start_codon:yes stop_codon:yes gene_type:complete
MNDFNYKLEKYLFPLIKKINNPIILELGVQKGRSTIKFLDICKENEGKLFSVDVNDCSSVSNDKNWKFIKSRDDNFEYIINLIPKKINVLFIDTIHEAAHVENLIYAYYDILEVGGFIFIDDISHLPYLKNSKRNNFYCEINNKETFSRIIEIYNSNSEAFDLSFSFNSSGLAIIEKKINNKLNQKNILKTRDRSIKNYLRKLKNIINV